MAKKAPTLDTPFKKGETVLAARAVRGAPEGTTGKIKLINGLGEYDGNTPWMRYWVRFDDIGLVGQVSHDDLVRPKQYGAWLDREEERKRAELAALTQTAEATTEAPAAAADAGGGVAALIPAALLERSKAAKARLLGG